MSGNSGKGLFMRRELAVDGGHCIQSAIGRAPTLAAPLVRQLISAVSDCFEPLRGVAADFASIPSARCTRPTARAAITISFQAKGEWRVPRFNY
jgi:hypothetical protein